MVKDSDGIVVATRPLRTKMPINGEMRHTFCAHSTRMTDLENLFNVGSAKNSHDFEGNNVPADFTLPNVPEASTGNWILSQLLHPSNGQTFGIETGVLG